LGGNTFVGGKLQDTTFVNSSLKNISFINFKLIHPKFINTIIDNCLGFDTIYLDEAMAIAPFIKFGDESENEDNLSNLVTFIYRIIFISFFLFLINSSFFS
jgi:Ca2+-binding RTX toxin-like protein